MKMTDEDILRLTIDAPTEELEKYTPYGDFLISHFADDTLAGHKDLLEEQMITTLREINRLRGEMPIAIHFWENEPKGWPKMPKTEKDARNFGWTAWTDKKRQASVPL